MNMAVASENEYKGVKVNELNSKNELIAVINSIVPNVLTNKNVVYLCIGTDRITGDSLAPFVGTYLTGLGYKNVYGTIDNPVHAKNLEETINIIPSNKTIIAIDASLGELSDVEKISFIKGSIKPGAGVGKDLGETGDYGIHGCVNVHKEGFEYMSLMNTRLSVVIKMAKDIASALIERFPLTETQSAENAKKFVSRAKNENIVNRLKKKGYNAKLTK
ncbi:spore protease YyaC [Paenibacillus sp. NRS-1775]|uniref:spore protease YyaC n=1 Tax=unclassified Paenibacillus TaxID=185978 RepID=UPI003D284D99